MEAKSTRRLWGFWTAKGPSLCETKEPKVGMERRNRARGAADNSPRAPKTREKLETQGHRVGVIGGKKRATLGGSLTTKGPSLRETEEPEVGMERRNRATGAAKNSARAPKTREKLETQGRRVGVTGGKKPATLG